MALDKKKSENERNELINKFQKNEKIMDALEFLLMPKKDNTLTVSDVKLIAEFDKETLEVRGKIKNLLSKLIVENKQIAIAFANLSKKMNENFDKQYDTKMIQNVQDRLDPTLRSKKESQLKHFEILLSKTTGIDFDDDVKTFLINTYKGLKKQVAALSAADKTKPEMSIQQELLSRVKSPNMTTVKQVKPQGPEVEEKTKKEREAHSKKEPTRVEKVNFLSELKKAQEKKGEKNDLDIINPTTRPRRET